MDGAALLAFLAAVGFGWQPMPDGSERYEYIVQVDQDLATTLANGKSIPIVAEVPEEIHPIGRVRILVGEGDLPRERLVTRLKPVVAQSPPNQSPTKTGAEESIVIRGQNAVAPNPYAESATGWNGGAAPAPVPSSQQLFENASSAVGQAWNENVAAPASEALNNAGQNLQNQLVAPVQQQFDNAAGQLQQNAGALGQNLQNSAASLGERTKSLVNELGRSTTPQPALTARDLRNQTPASVPVAAVPPPGTGAAAGLAPYNSGAAAPVNNAASTWNGQAPPATNPLRSNVPPASQQSPANEWNGQQEGFPAGSPLAQPNSNNFASGAASPPASSNPSTFNAADPAGTASEWNGAAASNGANPPPALTNAGGAGSLAESDPWQGVPNPQLPAASGATPPPATLTGGQPAPFGGAGSTWPGDVAPPGTAPLAGANLGVSPPNLATPSISSNMLGQAPDRPLEGSAAPLAGVGGVPAANVSTGNASLPPASTPPDIFANRPNAATPAANNQQPAANGANSHLASSANNAASGGNSTGNDNAVVTLVAWVLLFGSAFGNLYLFWSYLDVRQKYRSLVRKTARAVGSRFSAA